MSRIVEKKTLKSLQTIIEKKKAEQADVRLQIKCLKNTEESLSSEIKKLHADITKMESNTKKLIVTEHAVLRYLEKTYSFDLEEIKANLAEGIPKGLNGRYPKEGRVLVVKNNTIITVI